MALMNLLESLLGLFGVSSDRDQSFHAAPPADGQRGRLERAWGLPANILGRVLFHNDYAQGNSPAGLLGLMGRKRPFARRIRGHDNPSRYVASGPHPCSASARRDGFAPG